MHLLMNIHVCIGSHENKPYMLIRPKYIEGLSNLITFF